MRIYISIPISGRDIEQVKQEIDAVKTALAKIGHEGISPLEGITDFTLPWVDYLLRDIRILEGCDGVCFVSPRNAQYSYGCHIEHIISEKLNLQRFEFFVASGKLVQITK